MKRIFIISILFAGIYLGYAQQFGGFKTTKKIFTAKFSKHQVDSILKRYGYTFVKTVPVNGSSNYIWKKGALEASYLYNKKIKGFIWHELNSNNTLLENMLKADTDFELNEESSRQSGYAVLLYQDRKHHLTIMVSAKPDIEQTMIMMTNEAQMLDE